MGDEVSAARNPAVQSGPMTRRQTYGTSADGTARARLLGTRAGAAPAAPAAPAPARTLEAAASRLTDRSHGPSSAKPPQHQTLASARGLPGQHVAVSSSASVWRAAYCWVLACPFEWQHTDGQVSRRSLGQSTCSISLQCPGLRTQDPPPHNGPHSPLCACIITCGSSRTPHICNAKAPR